MRTGRRAAKFHEMYLPDATPGSPQERIDLPKQVTSRGWSSSYLPTLYWIDEDRLLFNVYKGNYSDTLLRSFLIVPSNSEIRELEGDERQALANAMEKSSSVVSADTLGNGIAEVGQVVVGLALAIATRGGGNGSLGGGGSSKYHYAGTIENNGAVLSLDISVESKKHWGPFGSFRSRYYKCDYLVKNITTGTTVKANKSVESDKLKDELRDWLRSWRVSPDGRLYMIGKTATLLNSETGNFTTLIENYRDNYAGFDVSPQWNKIALLKTEWDKETKQTKYWIEFYRLDAR